MSTHEKPAPEAIEACIARVLAAEREAQASIESAKGRAAAEIAQARARVHDPDARALLQAAVDTVNHDLAQFERIKKFVLFTEDLTIANGLLTPTMKVKRRVFEGRYRAEIEGMYS